MDKGLQYVRFRKFKTKITYFEFFVFKMKKTLEKQT